MTRFTAICEPGDGEAATTRRANWRDRTPSAVLAHWARRGVVLGRSDDSVVVRIGDDVVTVVIEGEGT